MQILKFESNDKKIYTGCEFDGEQALVIEGNIFSDFSVSRIKKPVKKFLPPVTPPAIFCIGLNYRLHAKETGAKLPEYPVVFMKNPGAATGHQNTVQIPSCCIRGPEVDYEAELAVVIQKTAKNVPPEKALDYVLGYTCANDVSARKWQKNAGGGQWCRGKGFDTFCPFGPWIVTKEDIFNPNLLDIECVLNGKTMQKSNTKDMIFSVAQIVSFLSQSTTLLPGTLILTGTPEGVGFTRKPPVFLEPGDELKTKIQDIGTLKNRITFEN